MVMGLKISIKNIKALGKTEFGLCQIPKHLKTTKVAE